MLLWCVWSSAHFETPGELLIRKADDLSRRWTAAVSSPLRMARRALASAPIKAPALAVETLKSEIKKSELEAERLEQAALETLARDNLNTASDEGGAAVRARKALAAYIRLTDAAKTPGFSVSLLEELIGLTFPPSESDGECVVRAAR